MRCVISTLPKNRPSQTDWCYMFLNKLPACHQKHDWRAPLCRGRVDRNTGQVTAPQGALLLVLFNVSHAVEHLLTDKAQGNLASLLEKAPQTATIVQATAEGQPDLGRTDTVRAENVRVGSLMLVRPGEQVGASSESCQGVPRRFFRNVSSAP